MDESRDFMNEWWPVLFIFGFLAALFIFVFTIGKGEGGSTAEALKDKDSEHGDATELSASEQFWAAIEEHQPVYTSINYECLVDGTEIPVPNKQSDNRLGGVATDLMKIALGPPKSGLGRPDFELQEFEQLLCTCPACGATYMQIDLINMRSGMVPGALDAIKKWDLAEALPGLAGKPVESWTYDEKSLVRYLTMKQAGFPNYELGFYALSGAYCSNFAVWYGRDYTVPSPAFYALAAAEMSRDLEAGIPERSNERAPTALALGEAYRLLDRPEDAKHWFSEAEQLFRAAHEGGAIKDEDLEHYLQVTAAMQEMIAEGNSSLNVVNIPGMPPPPLGSWYLEEMLPNINGHIIQHRGDWSGLKDPSKIIEQISSLFP